MQFTASLPDNYLCEKILQENQSYAPRCAPPTCLPALLDVLVLALPPPFGAINADLLVGNAFFFLSFLFFPVLNNDISDNL